MVIDRVAEWASAPVYLGTPVLLADPKAPHQPVLRFISIKLSLACTCSPHDPIEIKYKWADGEILKRFHEHLAEVAT